jgi:predicted nucleic acid-binding protein
VIATCVVDASVGIKLFIEEDGSKQADLLFRELAENPESRFYVPDLFFVECTNILWKYVRHFDYPAENARQDVTDLCALALRSISTADLMVSGLALALEYRITAYDACYAALAQQTRLPLVTADVAFIQKLEGSGIEFLDLQRINSFNQSST